jgi:hypothetical protein
MGSLLLVESFDSRPSNQYILVKVIPSCFRFAKMCLCECSSEVLCASVLVKSGLETRNYRRRGSAALTMRHLFIRKSWN